MLCVFTATIFWFFNALNKTYTTNINFPLAFDYDSENFIPVEGLPQTVRLNVTGNGWELFKRSTGVKQDPLEIPLEGLEEGARRHAVHDHVAGVGAGDLRAVAADLPRLRLRVLDQVFHR